MFPLPKAVSLTAFWQLFFNPSIRTLKKCPQDSLHRMAFQDYFGYRIVTKAMKISLSPKATIKYSKANILSVSPAASVLPVKKKTSSGSWRKRYERQVRQGRHGETGGTWGDSGHMVYREKRRSSTDLVNSFKTLSLRSSQKWVRSVNGYKFRKSFQRVLKMCWTSFAYCIVWNFQINPKNWQGWRETQASKNWVRKVSH